MRIVLPLADMLGHRCAVVLLILVCSSYSRVVVHAQDTTGWRNKQAEVCFLLDSSSSVWIKDYTTMLTFVSNLVSDMDIGPNATRVGVGVFAEDHKLHISIASGWTKDILKREIMNAPYLKGNTYISRALKGLREQCLPRNIVRSNVPLIAVLFTDGSSRHKQLTADNATLVKEAGISLVTVGIGNYVDRDELRLIASDPKSAFSYQVASFDHLMDIRAQLSSKMSQVVVYQGEEGTCGKKVKVDTVFVFDEAAIGDRDTQKIKTFIAAVVDNASMNSGNLRAGVVSKTCHEGDIALGQFVTKEDFAVGLQNKDGPDVSDLLKRVRQFSFLPENGARSDAKNRIVMFLHASVAKRAATTNEARRAIYAGIETFVIRMGNDYDKNFINGLASKTENIMYPGTADDLIKQESINAFNSIFCAGL